jgi:MYXO-CTERM domain-containing protein
MVGRRAALLLLCAAGWLARPSLARANGAFPDSQNVITPAAFPNTILLATNFGLVSSLDGGHAWTWTCEQPLNSYATFYQMGPTGRLYAISSAGLIFSDDNSCTWSAAAGGLGPTAVFDAFVDPTNANRVLAVVAFAGDGGAIHTVVESSDAGASFTQLRYTAASGDTISGVETARVAASTVYLSVVSGTGMVPNLVRSADGGVSWHASDLSAGLPSGANAIRIIAVDPQDPNKVFLRVGAPDGEVLAVATATDTGATATVPLPFPGGIISAFTRTADGTIVIGGVVGVDNVAYRSTDGGATFQQLPTPPSLRALSARGNMVYAVADNYNDGYAIGTSVDYGMSWQPLMQYDQVQAIQTCVKAQCQTDCAMRANSGQWAEAVCSATAPPPPPEGGSDSGAGGMGGASGADAGSDGKPTTGSTSGCHCATSGGGATAAWTIVLVLPLLVRRRRVRAAGPRR